MGQMYTFHKSVRGQSHINRNKPCEDSSVSYSSDDGRYHIAIIADGHGQEKSFRSKTGSQIAVDIALECLKGFAQAALSTDKAESRFYHDILGNPRYRQMIMRQLTDTILAGWSDRIHEDYSTNPPSEEEFGEFAAYFQDETRVPQIYGTTLIASLKLPKCLVLLHQGDGRCDVFYADGSVNQPIPWDDRCQGNQTTSLCDEDAAQSFRHCVINTESNPVVACYVGSDGVEDAYRTQEGTHTFYRDLSCVLVEKNGSDFDAYLDEMLPEFSARGRFGAAGSLDDVSVAGIVDIDAIKELVVSYKIEVQKYALCESIFWKEDALRSKTRGHGILKKRMEEAQERLTQAESPLHALESEREAMVSELGTLQERIQQYQLELDDHETEASNANSPSRPLQDLFHGISGALSPKQIQRARMQKEYDELTQRIQNQEVAIAEAQTVLNTLQAQADLAKSTFEEYDAKYQAIISDINELREQISDLPLMPS